MNGQPGKEGGLLEEQAVKSNTLPQGCYNFADGQACTHADTFYERLPESSIHWAKQKCATCGRTLKFLPKPSTLARQEFNGYRILKLQMRPKLTQWERRFVDSIAAQKRLSPRQSEILTALCAKYLQGQ
jgi:hypothetical protein